MVGMSRCPFYNICDTKNPGFCESTENLLLCKTHNKLKKQSEIEIRAKQILKKGIRIRL